LGSALVFAPAHTPLPVVNPGELTPEAYIDNASDVVGFGYGESKWIGETLLRRAAEVTPMKPVSVRVGQLSGGSNGNWNASDWVPNIVRTSKALGAAPDVPGVRPIRLTANPRANNIYSGHNLLDPSE